MAAKKIISLFLAVVMVFSCAGVTALALENDPAAADHEHIYGDPVITAATLSANGKLSYLCSECGEEKTEIIAMITDISLQYESMKYTGSPRENKVTVRDSDGKTLVNGTDFTVNYRNNGIVSGTAYVDVAFTGKYSGSVTKSFKITHTHTYGEYKLTKAASTSASGTLEKECSVCGNTSEKSISAVKTVTLSKTSYVYTGKAITPSVTVKDKNGVTLKKGTDYTVAYKNNTKVGTASVTVTFKGNYKGSLSKTFKITHDHTYGAWTSVKRATTSASGTAKHVCKGCGYTTTKTVPSIKSVTLSKTSAEYTGKAITVTVTVKDKNGTSLKKGTDYTVAYKNNTSFGTVSVTVTFKGLYSDSITKTFKIVPPATSITKATPGSTEILLKWTKKTTGVQGYQVKYATDSAFTKNVHTKKFTSNKQNVGMIYDQSPKTTYYIMIRTYKTVSGKTYYSPWSASKKVTTTALTAHHIAGQLPKSARVKTSYFDDVVLVGDSISLGLTYYEAANRKMGNVQFLTAGSLGACNALWAVSEKSVHPRYNGVKMKLEKSIPLTKANKVYIMLGMNDISYGLDYAFDHYKTLLSNIHKAAPDAMIYIESVTPRVYQGSNMSNPYLNNTNITKYNKMLSDYCRTKGWFFVNVAEVMFDSNGYLKRSYCGDPDGMGMHYLWTGCEAWVDYLYTHTAE